MLDTNGKEQVEIAVDGGIKPDNITEVAKAGANMFVMGSALFDSDDYKKTISTIKKNLVSKL